jgi:hypothetical protein
MNAHKGFSVASMPSIGVWLLMLVVGITLLIHSAANQSAPGIIGGFAIVGALAFLSKGFFQVAPNEGQVLQLFGK